MKSIALNPPMDVRLMNALASAFIRRTSIGGFRAMLFMRPPGPASPRESATDTAPHN